MNASARDATADRNWPILHTEVPRLSDLGDTCCALDHEPLGIHPNLAPCARSPWVERAIARTLPAKEYAR